MTSPLAGTLHRLFAVAITIALASPSSVAAAAPATPPGDTAAPSGPTPPTEAPPTEPTAPASDAPPADTPPAETPSPDENKPAPATTTSDAKPLGSRSGRVSDREDKSPATRKAPQGDTATVLEGSPERMRQMQKAGWWTLFGGFVFATVGGVFSGLAERQEDKAERIAVRFDEDSAQPQYADVKDDYEQILGRGRAFASTAIALGVIGGALAVAGITLLAVDEARLRKRTGKGKRRARLELRKGGLQVKF